MLRLAKAGYGGGNPETIEKMNTKWILKMIDYEDFCHDYQEEHHNLNKDG